MAYGYGGYGYQDPYGQQGYYGPSREGNQGSAIGAAVANGLTMVCCCFPGGAVGLVLSIIGLTKLKTDPDSADNLTKWSWITFGISLAIGILAWGAYIVFVVWLEAASMPYDPYDDY